MTPLWYADQSDDKWSVRRGTPAQAQGESSLVMLKEKGGAGKELEVYEQRLGKAKLKLDYDNCLDVLKSTAC